MKKKNKKYETDNFVFSKDHRDLVRYIVPFFCIPFLLAISVYFWIDVFRHPADEYRRYFAAAFFLMDIALTINFYRHKTINEMQFNIKDHCITNTIPHKKDIKLNLFDPLYISHVSVDFYYGKGAKITKAYYLFSSRPFSINDYKGDDGLVPLEHFHKLGIIISPKNERVDEWLCTELKINDIPEFPRSVEYNTENQFGNGIDSSPGLMLDG